MKRLLLLTSAFLIAIASAEAQQTQTEAHTISKELTQLGTPSNPALTLMGVQPLEITRPKSLKQVESSLINSFVQEGSFAIPDNFGLEVMPYWLTPQPNKEFNYDDLVKNEMAPLENLSLSLASVNQNMGDTAFNTQLGFGARTLLFSGHIKEEQANHMRALSEAFLSETKAYPIVMGMATKFFAQPQPTYQALQEKMIADADANLPDEVEEAVKSEIVKAFNATLSDGAGLTSTLTPNDQILFLQEIISLMVEKMNSDEFKEKAKAIEDLQIRKYGFMWELAGATFLDFPTGDIEFSIIPKLGVWTTLSYKLPNQKFDFLGTVRYIRDFQLEQNTSNIDFGGSIVWNLSKFSLAAEGIERMQTSTIERTVDEDGFALKVSRTTYDYRAAVNASYRISDKIVISYSFGKQFDISEMGNNSNMINQFSINFGAGNVPLTL